MRLPRGKSKGILTRPNIPPRNDKPSHSFTKKAAFTLAEVLITLGIIGVVAALTIPTLMTEIRTKVLEVQFKDTFAIINQAWRLTKADSEYDDLYSVYTAYDPSLDYYRKAELQEAFENHLKKSHILQGNFISSYSTYSSAQIPYESGNDFRLSTPKLVLQNGALLQIDVYGSLDGKHISFLVDINGTKKPNRAGFDLFLFVVSDSSDTIKGRRMDKLYTEEELGSLSHSGLQGFPCSVKSKQSSNGIGCAAFALENKCPDYVGKKYWECLPK